MADVNWSERSWVNFWRWKWVNKIAFLSYFWFSTKSYCPGSLSHLAVSHKFSVRQWCQHHTILPVDHISLPIHLVSVVCSVDDTANFKYSSANNGKKMKRWNISFLLEMLKEKAKSFWSKALHEVIRDEWHKTLIPLDWPTLTWKNGLIIFADKTVAFNSNHPVVFVLAIAKICSPFTRKIIIIKISNELDNSPNSKIPQINIKHT